MLAELPKADQIHIATHRVIYPAYSGKSALLFSTDDDCDVSHEVEASLLTESEIRKLDLSKARLVVLSACESAAVENETSSEGMGLAGAFLDAGARTVIATVWPIEDRAARAFHDRFLPGTRSAKKEIQERRCKPRRRRSFSENRANGISGPGHKGLGPLPGHRLAVENLCTFQCQNSVKSEAPSKNE